VTLCPTPSTEHGTEQASFNMAWWNRHMSTELHGKGEGGEMMRKRRLLSWEVCSSSWGEEEGNYVAWSVTTVFELPSSEILYLPRLTLVLPSYPAKEKHIILKCQAYYLDRYFYCPRK
jgi:hypothetical protein